MSNEKDTSNRPRRYTRTGNSTSVSRSRKFSCITYLNELQLKVCLQAHCNQIRCYAYAYHDKDKKEDGTLKEPHTHLILVLYCATSLSAVRRWFSGYSDENGEITTTAQICSDVFSQYDYLTHNTPQARAEGKYQYDKSIVKVNKTAIEERYFQASEESNFDSITLATEMLLKGAKVHDCGKIFGRDFILHYNAINQYVNDILEWESNDYTHINDMLTKRRNTNV